MRLIASVVRGMLRDMNGAQSLAATLVNCGIEVCFANPGTSEIHFVAALQQMPDLRPVLCLFEGVATGAADGYGRIAGKPAMTLLHLGPGLANGLANLHNARRAATPIVNVVGDHATYHLQYDAPLTSDIIGFARPVSSWLHRSNSAKRLASDAARAVQAAMAPPGAIATLIVPADVAWAEADTFAHPLPANTSSAVDRSIVDDVARRIAGGKRTALLLRGPALRGAGLEAAGLIKARSGARLLCDTFAPHLEAGAGRVLIERIPYFADQIVDFLRDLEQIVLVGAEPPVSFFAYPGKPSWCAPATCEVHYLAFPHENGVAALQSVADRLHDAHNPVERAALKLPGIPSGQLTAATAAQVIAELTPENAIFADDAATSRLPILRSLSHGRPFTHLPLTGGSIGLGMPLAVGAALAAPDRKVVCTQGDGGAAYTLQALWTMARERLDVTTLVFSNRAYAILKIELERCGIESSSTKAFPLFDLCDPELHWTRIAEGFGVEASRAETCDQFASQYASAVKTRAPRLIELML